MVQPWYKRTYSRAIVLSPIRCYAMSKIQHLPLRFYSVFVQNGTFNHSNRHGDARVTTATTTATDPSHDFDLDHHDDDSLLNHHDHDRERQSSWPTNTGRRSRPRPRPRPLATTATTWYDDLQHDNYRHHHEFHDVIPLFRASALPSSTPPRLPVLRPDHAV